LLLGGIIGGVAWYRSSVSERPLLPVGLREQVEDKGANDPSGESTFSLSFIPVELAFGEVLLEDRAQKSLQIKNESSQPLEIESFEIVDGQTEDFALMEQTCTAGALLPGKRCQAGVLFEPTAAGDRTAKLKINALNSEGSLVFLSGVGTSRAASEPVNRVDAPPSVLQVNNDQVSVRSGGSVVVDVLANDVSSDGSALLIAEAGQPAAGETRIEGGRVVYAHGGGGGARDRFTYTAKDASGQSASATVVITIENDDPPATPEPTPAPTSAPSIETDNLPDSQNEPDQTTPPAPTEETEIEPEPAPTVDPAINEQQPPSVSDYTFTIELGDSLTVNLLENARDPNPNDVLRVAEVANTPVGGDLIDNGDGTVTYLPWQGPEAEQFGTFINNFQFVITDDNGGFAQGTLSIRVVVPALQAP
ncbi:MAG: cadherin-like domain-containing protein, partial [Cyanobacteria bacterium J06607_13]